MRSGDPRLIRDWLESRVGQWDTIEPCMLASYQAAHEPGVAEQTEQWFEDVVGGPRRWYAPVMALTVGGIRFFEPVATLEKNRFPRGVAAGQGTRDRDRDERDGA